MIFVVTIIAGAVALVLHVAGVPAFGDIVSVPVAALVAMCALGVIGRFLPHMRARLVALVPPALPRPALVVWLSALCEAAAVVGLLVPALRAPAAAALAVFLLAVFPANVRGAHLSGDGDGTFLRRLLVRGAEQIVFIGLCVWTLVAS